MGGKLNAWVTADPTTWDGSDGVSSVSDRWKSRAYESLLSYKMGPDVKFIDMILTPGLAERWEAAPDGKSYTFYLRKGAKFQDLPPVNGREVTAADVKFSLEYTSRTGPFKQLVDDKKLNPSLYAQLFEGMEAVETPNASTIKVSFKEPYAPFLNYAAFDKNPVYAKEVFEKDGHFKDTLVGTGGFMLDMASSQRGSRWVMKKNPNYWQPGKPYLDEIVGFVLPDASTAFAAFKVGQVDMLGDSGYTMGSGDMKRLQSENPTAVYHEADDAAPEHMYLNVRRAPFNNEKVRQALALAFDRDEYMKVFSDGQGSWALPGAMPDSFTEAEIKQMLPRDPERAKRLLEEAGYKDGLNIEFSASVAYGDIYQQKAQLIQSWFKKAGFNMTIKTLDHPAYLSQTRGNTFDLTFRGKNIPGGDVDGYLYSVFHPTSSNNYGGVNDPELTRLVEQSRREVDPTKRREVVRTAVKIIADKAYNLAFVYSKSNHAWKPLVKNYAPHWGTSGWPLLETWVER